jgi:hypothetical protein
MDQLQVELGVKQGFSPCVTSDGEININDGIRDIDNMVNPKS